LNDSQAGRFYLWRVAGATLPPSAITLTPPASATALEPLTITGQLTLSDGTALGAQQLAVTRTIYNNRQGGITDRLADVVTDSRGEFQFSDTPAQGGRYVYTVRWAGTAVYDAASADHEVSVSSTASQLSGIVQQPAYVGEPFFVAGGVSFDVGDCVGPTTIHVTRQIGTGAGGAAAGPDHR
jgi:hypothetical protein